MHRPALLIADEPTSALDAVTQAEILALCGELNRRLGMSMLLISHDLVSAYGLCHRIALISAGKMWNVIPARNLLQPSAPIHAEADRRTPTIPSSTEIEQALRF